MDILDIILAKSMSSTGQIDSYAKKAEQAVKNANAAVANIDTITEQTQANNELAQETLATANDILDRLDTNLTEVIDQEIAELTPANNYQRTDTAVTNSILFQYPSDLITYDIETSKYYKQKGTNEDGTMTQKAITTELNALETAMSQIEGNPNLGSQNAGKIVVVGSDGHIVAGSHDEEDIDGGGDTPTPTPTPTSITLGVTIDYVNRTVTRDDENLTPGAAFDNFPMYKRRRCNLDNEGHVLAYYGDSNYREDGSNGQVMVEQPPFYYRRSILLVTDGKIQKERLEISDTQQTNFHLHPMFGSDNTPVYFSAYQGSCYDVSENSYATNDNVTVNFNTDMLSSVANAKPLAGGSRTLTRANAITMANNRGDHWTITNMAFESVNQILFIIEYASLNAQVALGRGVVDLPSVSNANNSVQTGATANLGNASGEAASSTLILGNNITTFNESGKRSVSYRGIENLWGNGWRFVKDFEIGTNGVLTRSTLTVPKTSSWISRFGYDEENDYIYFPTEASGATSLLPVGDYVWASSSFSDPHVICVGGASTHGDNCGLFNYAYDYGMNNSAYSKGARLTFIPETK